MNGLLLALAGAALVCALVAILLGVTGGTALSPTHTPDRRTRRPDQTAPAPEHETTTEDLS